MTENLNAENGTTPTDGRDDAGLTALVEAALLEIADDTTNAEPAAAAIDATIDTLKESILGELWPEERSVLTGLGPAAARSSDAAVAPAPAPPPSVLREWGCSPAVLPATTRSLSGCRCRTLLPPPLLCCVCRYVLWCVLVLSDG